MGLFEVLTGPMVRTIVLAPAGTPGFLAFQDILFSPITSRYVRVSSRASLDSTTISSVIDWSQYPPTLTRCYRSSPPGPSVNYSGFKILVKQTFPNLLSTANSGNKLWSLAFNKPRLLIFSSGSSRPLKVSAYEELSLVLVYS
jgi:hypothetical protein